MGKTSSAGRVPELDALRGFAALAVLFTHLPRGFWFGTTGVDLFFVLSGFLISSIVIKNYHKEKFLWNFYARRSLRIWPIYYLAILVAVALNLLRQHPYPVDGLPYYLTYTQNVWDYWGGQGPNPAPSLDHTWTLAIEEQFYLLWPALLILVRRKYMPYLAAAFVVAPLVLRGAFGLTSVTLFGHTDGLALGALLAWARYGREINATSVKEVLAYTTLWLAPLAGYFGLWAYQSAHGESGKFMIHSNPAISLVSLSYFGLVGLVQLGQGSPWLRWLRNPVLAYVGLISYGLYLYHWIIYENLDTIIKFRWGHIDPWWLDVVKIVTSFGAAVLSWHFIEQPILRLKDRFSYQRQNASEVVPTLPRAQVLVNAEER